MSATILLIDDEKLVCDPLACFLERLGYRVLTARTGEEGVDIYRREGAKVDLVILDWILPGGGGAWTLAELRGVEPDCRVAVFSGQPDALEGVDADAFIFKPVAMPVFLDKIRALLPAEDLCLTGE